MFTRHYVHLNAPVSEGGGSRMSAISHIAAKMGAKQKIFSKRMRLGRLFEGISLIFRLFFMKNEVVLIHYSIFPALFSKYVVSNHLFSRITLSLLDYCGSRNTVYMEVNDLPYEQAIDLELPENRMDIFDRAIFATKNVNFIFASVEMARYAKIKYSISEARVSSLINGSYSPARDFDFPTWFDRDRSGLVFVYAGSLNRGRQIDDVIKLFIGSNHSLVLLGVGGDWVQSEFNGSPNIYYLGSFPEKIAQGIVKKCDIGIIPYDENRFYYNICYPTKASFYAASGLPILSTPLTELRHHFSEETAFFAPLSDWNSVLSDPDLSEKVKAMRSVVIHRAGSNFLWDNLWKAWLDENMRVVG